MVKQGFINSLLAANKELVPVDPVYLNDNFNVCGINDEIADFKVSLTVLRNNIMPSTPELKLSAKAAYLLIHARFLQTKDGIVALYSNMLDEVYSTCPRCDFNLLPYGIFSNLGAGNAHTFCLMCSEIYTAYDENLRELDGAAFGPYIALFFLASIKPGKRVIENLHILRKMIERDQDN